MKLNSIVIRNSTTLRSKEKCGLNCEPKPDRQKATISYPVYNKLMRLAMILIVAGSPIAISSCSSDTDSEETVEVAEQTETQANMTNMAAVLGIMSVQKSTIVDTCFVKQGDIIEMGWTDGYFNEDINLEINDDLCTRTKMVYDGTRTDNDTGNTTYVRHTFSSDDDEGVNEKIEVTADGKAINKNSEFINIKNYNYVTSVDEILKYKTFSDGSERFEGTYTPNSSNSVTYTLDTGSSHDFTGIFVGQK